MKSFLSSLTFPMSIKITPLSSQLPTKLNQTFFLNVNRNLLQALLTHLMLSLPEKPHSDHQSQTFAQLNQIFEIPTIVLRTSASTIFYAPSKSFLGRSPVVLFLLKAMIISMLILLTLIISLQLQKFSMSHCKSHLISKDDLDSAIDQMKNGKEPGLDALSPEFWKMKNIRHILLKFCVETFLGDRPDE